MNKYETVFILTPVLSDAQMKEAVEKFKTVLTDNGGSIVNEENWGLRKLAYNIQKKSTGFYTLIEFDGEPTLVDKLEIAFRRDEKVLRFLTFRLDKFAAEYAIKRRNKRAQAAAEAAAAPAVEEAPAPAVEEVAAPVIEEAAPAIEEAAAPATQEENKE